ncbi:HepT-like ribonuclease domain-containing protein [Cellulomonas hominis]
MQRDRLFVAEMIDACVRIGELAADRDAAAVDGDPTARDALYWNFTVLGEAAGRVSEPVRESHPDIPWRRAAAMRNRIVHGYWSVDTDVLVSTAREIVPDLLTQLREMQAGLS